MNHLGLGHVHKVEGLEKDRKGYSINKDMPRSEFGKFDTL